MEGRCKMCHCKLIDPGGILFSPPVDKYTEKTQLCSKCYKIIKRVIDSDRFVREEISNMGVEVE